MLLSVVVPSHLVFQSISGAGSSVITQTKMNVWRAVTQNARETGMLYALVAMLVLLGMVFGLLFLNQVRQTATDTDWLTDSLS